MKFSMSLPLLRDLDAKSPYRETFELAAIAEAAGFDTVTIGQHHFRQGDPADPLTLLAGIVTRTNTLRVGTGIYILPMHNPVLVAEQVATIDQLSGGRISLGVGTGWNRYEYEVLGKPYAARGRLMEEALEVLRLAWTTEHATYHGEFNHFDDLSVFPRPVQSPSPPLWVAGTAAAAIDRAARLGDAWLCGPVESHDAAVRCSTMYREACDRVGKRPEWILRRFGWMKPTRREVEEGILPAYVEGLMAHWRESALDADTRELIERVDSGKPITPAEIARGRLLWGGPDDVIEQIKQFEQSLDVQHIHVAFGTGMPAEGVNQSSLGDFAELSAMVELYGREVIANY